MKREVIESLLIGYLATYLPIFDYSSGRIVGALVIGALVFAAMVAVEEEQETGWIKKKCLYGLSVSQIKLADAVAVLRKMRRSLRNQRKTSTEAVTQLRRTRNG